MPELGFLVLDLGGEQIDRGGGEALFAMGLVS